MTSEFEWKKKLLENILPNLKCLKCETPPRPEGLGRQRHVCSGCGKAICGDCFGSSKSKKCEFSKEDFKCKGSYCKASCETIEDTLKELPFACKNRKHGCQEIRLKDLEDHEEECIYRLIHCADPDCEEKVPLIEFLKHFGSHEFEKPEGDILKKPVGNPRLSEVFEDNFRQLKNQRPEYLEGSWKTVDFSEKLGHPIFEVSKLENGFFYAWLYYLGSAEAASNFEYTYTMKKGYSNSKVTFSGNVISMDASNEEVMEDHDCLILRESQLLDFKRRGTGLFNYYVEYTVTLRDLKEEAKDQNEDSGVSDE